MGARDRTCRSAVVAVALVALLAGTAHAYVVPGSFPQEYSLGDNLDVNVNALYSNVTAVTYDFYSFPFCSHEGKARVDESLGEWFLGGRIRGAPFSFTFLKQEDKLTLCEKQIGKKGFAKLREGIDKQYRVRLILDNLPVTRLSVDKFFEMMKEYGKDAVFDTVDDSFSYIGYGIGGKEGNKYWVYNHLTFSVLYNDAEAKTMTKGFYMGEGMAVQTAEDVDTEDMYNIVGFQVLPCSVDKDVLESADFDPQNCSEYPKQYVSAGSNIQYSYSVYYEKSEVTWSQRWEPFLHVRGKPMHWYSFLDSLLIAMLLAILVASILLRTVRGDIARYEQGPGEIEREDTGWKLISGDVFRPPPSPGSLCTYIGAGVQVAACLFISLAFMALGLISPVKRGALMTWILVTYFMLAVLGGYAGVRYHVNITRSKEGWRLLAMRISLFLGGIVIAILTLLNIVLGAAKSTQGIPFLPMFFLFLMWVLLSIPLCFVGGYFASKRDPCDYPVRTNQIPREIVNKPTSIVAHPLFIVFLAGLLPFGVMYVDLYFIFSAMFEHLYYYAFGFLFGMVAITAIVCIEMSIVSTYMILCIEDYRWWWRSFYAGGSVALYFALYGLSYLIFDSGLVGGLSRFVFLCYLSIMSTIVYVSMGSLSFCVAYLFVRKIYAAIKAD
uniref:Transmembrane 9 superfamily member n=1 Tax=Chloropicon laureae TaxID=464258 RepID=A0A7S2Z4Z8_9CHLO|eukprot:CAMPEP_0197489240 /NCGR_PEP_ID=MMETSP1311-20131121/4074_1 /TAXON_ID=464262 /ORGANISM="Genus nov. species nov., Strain RCC856" /LENGTH=664 /DNA_ID=CAMNT_0043033511 /DNA_START=56 /DNA_END=2050 /DNA_ORIENTATION=-